jgi:hypothetical protein
MKKFIIIIEVIILVHCVQLSAACSADIKASGNVVIKQDKIDPADMEVIKNLDLLQNWDVLGPQGPDMNKLNVLDAKPIKGAGHDK